MLILYERLSKVLHGLLGEIDQLRVREDKDIQNGLELDKKLRSAIQDIVQGYEGSPCDTSVLVTRLTLAIRDVADVQPSIVIHSSNLPTRDHLIPHGPDLSAWQVSIPLLNRSLDNNLSNDLVTTTSYGRYIKIRIINTPPYLMLHTLLHLLSEAIRSIIHPDSDDSVINLSDYVIHAPMIAKHVHNIKQILLSLEAMGIVFEIDGKKVVTY